MTLFAKRVYRVVLKIPLGQVRTYKWVARRAGYAKAARAVGQVLKRNPWPGFIPCHRVVGSNKELGGYVFGVNRKKELLALEKNIARSLGSKGA